MARSFSYHETETGGIEFTSTRKIGDVRIPNYVYDMWMPVIGSDAVGVYAVYCRLEMRGAVKKMSMATLAKACRIGVKKLNSINDKLEKCGFVTVTKPSGAARLMHWTTSIEVHDPPQKVSKDIIDEFCGGDYDLLTPWFMDEPTEQVTHPESSKGNSGEVKEHPVKESEDNSNIEDLDMQPLGVEDAPPPPPITDPPPSDFELTQSAIKDACKVAINDTNRGQLLKATREALNTGKTPEQIAKFGKWFNETYWPGKYPNITQITSDWPKFEAAGSNGNGAKQDYVPIPIYNNKGEKVGVR